jgi:hypothetical protein
VIGVVALEFSGLDAGEIKRHPEVEALLVSRDTRAEVGSYMPKLA